jgi:hypothetical protein
VRYGPDGKARLVVFCPALAGSSENVSVIARLPLMGPHSSRDMIQRLPIQGYCRIVVNWLADRGYNVAVLCPRGVSHRLSTPRYEPAGRHHISSGPSYVS